jgi:hypothetical protein
MHLPNFLQFGGISHWSSPIQQAINSSMNYLNSGYVQVYNNIRDNMRSFFVLE